MAYEMSVQQTVDGGYILGGFTGSNDGDVSGHHGAEDYWIVKLDASGDLQWQKTLGGSNGDNLFCVARTSDQGYIVCGQSASQDGDVTGHNGYYDAWVVKLDASGTIQWQNALGGTAFDSGHSIRQTSDGGYIMNGMTRSSDGDVMGYHGNTDAWAVKLDPAGALEWQRALGGSGGDEGYGVRQTADGGYILTGTSDSNDGDATGNHGNGDVWVVKLDPVGAIEWQKQYGGSSGDEGYDIRPTDDGGYIVAAETYSSDQDVTGNHGEFDFWILKLDSVGNLVWQRALGGSEEDVPHVVQPTTDGGYAAVGVTWSPDGDVTNYHGPLGDFWLVKLDATGTLQWQKTMGGSSVDWPRSMEQTTDGGYIVQGYTFSNDGDVSGNHGQNDLWVVKLVGGTEWVAEHGAAGFTLSPNPARDQVHVAPEGRGTLVLSDATGRTVLRQEVEGQGLTLSLAPFARGLYMLALSTEGGRTNQRLMLE